MREGRYLTQYIVRQIEVLPRCVVPCLHVPRGRSRLLGLGGSERERVCVYYTFPATQADAGAARTSPWQIQEADRVANMSPKSRKSRGKSSQTLHKRDSDG